MKIAPRPPEEHTNSGQECCKNSPKCPEYVQKGARSPPQERPKGDLVTSLVMMKDMSFLSIFTAMLGNIVRMMYRNVVKIMLKEHVSIMSTIVWRIVLKIMFRISITMNARIM